MTYNILEEIESYSQKAADGVRNCLVKADLEDYKRFLDQMYHYTLTSGDKILLALKSAPNEELKKFFEHMYKEERHHYMLAVQDLKGFGTTPSKTTPKEVEEFNQFWASLEKGHFNGYLGALYIFENIADKVGKEVKDMLIRLGVNEKQRRWLSIHIEADEEHGALISDLVKKYVEADPATTLNAAKEAANRWVAVNAAPFQNA